MDGIRRIQKTNIATQHPSFSAIPVASQRRSFLKYMLLGSGVLMIGKLFGPSLSLFAATGEKSPIAFKNFHIIEKGKDLQFFDKGGNEIFTLDKTA